MADGRVVYDVVADTSGFDEDIKKTQNSASNGFKTVRNVGIAAFAAVGTAVAATAAGMVKLTQKGVAWNAQMETYQMAFTTLLGDAELAAQTIENIKADAAATPFDVDSLVNANQLLVGAGVSAEESREAIMALGDAVAATGGGSAELSRMAANLQQIKNVGQASAMDIKQFAAAGINIYAVLADYMGITAEEAAGMKVTYEDLTAALEYASAEGGMYFNAMANQSQTFNGMVSTLKDNIDQLIGSVTAGISAIIAEDALPKIIEWVKRLQAAFDEGGFDGLLEEATAVLGELLMAVVESAPKIATAVMEVLKGIVKVLNENSEQIMGAVFAILEAVLKAMLDAVPVILETIMLMLNAIFAKLCEYIAIFAGVAWDWIKEMAHMIADKAGELWAAIRNAVQGAWDEINKKIKDFKKVGGDLLTGLWQGISDKVEWLKRQVRGVVDKIKSWFTGKEGFDEHSPSKVFRVIGQYISEGLAEGILDGSKNVRVATNKLVEMASGIKKAQSSASSSLVGAALSALAAKDTRKTIPTLADAAIGILQTQGVSTRTPSLAEQAIDILQSQPVGTGDITVNINFTGSLSQLARILYPEILIEAKRTGNNMISGGL